MEARSRLASFFTSVFRGVDLARRLFLNLVFLFFVLLLLGLFASDAPVPVPGKVVLVVAPQGDLVEELSGDPLERAFERLDGAYVAETLVRDLDDVLHAAATDERIKAVLLDLDGMGGAGIPELEGLRRRIQALRDAGKPVYARADVYTRARYYLATAAEEIHIHPMGFVLLEGYGVYNSHYKDALDRLQVDWHVFRVGEYKSAVEPFLRDDMSPEVKASHHEWLSDLWRHYLARVAASRNLTPEALEASIEALDEGLRQNGGDAAQLALATGLVDHVGAGDDLDGRLVELVGEDEESHSFTQIGHEEYLKGVDRDGLDGVSGGDAVGVLIASGEILDGTHPPGIVGGDTTSQLVRQAANDDRIKALVLRVDSPGGSTLASEVVRHEIALLRKAGKPVVVSMGSVAASGGYWISTASDEIWAEPTTITGSIGIYGMFPTFQRSLDHYLGIHVDGVGTNWLSGTLRLDRQLDPRLAGAIQLVVERGYEDFLGRVGEARKMDRAAVDAIARGRVWSGEDAKEVGLVDRLGGLDEAIASAAEKANLEKYDVAYVERPLDLTDQLLIDLLSSSAGHRVATLLGRARSLPPLVEAFGDLVAKQLASVARLRDPRGVYAYCFCTVD